MQWYNEIYDLIGTISFYYVVVVFNPISPVILIEQPHLSVFIGHDYLYFYCLVTRGQCAFGLWTKGFSVSFTCHLYHL